MNRRHRRGSARMQSWFFPTIAVAAVLPMVTASSLGAEDLPRQIYDAWKARHEATKSLEVTFEGTAFTPAKSRTVRTPSGSHVRIPGSDRTDPMRCSFLFTAPDMLFYETKTVRYNPTAVRYEPYRALMVFAKTTIEHLTMFDSSGKDKWQASICSRSTYEDSRLRLDGAEVAHVLTAYRPFQFKIISGFSAHSIPHLQVVTPSVMLDGRDCVVLRGVPPRHIGDGRKYELVVARDLSFLPVRIKIFQPGQSGDVLMVSREFKYDKSGVLSSWNWKFWPRSGKLTDADEAHVTSFRRNHDIPASRFKIDFPEGCPREDAFAAKGPINRSRATLWSWTLCILGVLLTCVAFLFHFRREKR